MNKDNPFVAYRHRARYHEVDLQGVVYNAHYLTFFDIALGEYLRALNFALPPPGASHDFHVARATVDYRRPIRLDEEVDITVRVARLGRSSVTFALEALGMAGEGDVRAMGEVVWVWTDQQAGKATALPAALKERLAG
ncbi:MAG: acyl-CoA thioesterase [Pseudomonadota bacterium]